MKQEMIEVQIEGRPHAVPAGSTLAALVTALGHRPEAVATAVNGRFVPREARAQHVLAAGDSVLLFGRIVGG